MKKYESPQSETIELKYTHYLLDTSADPDPEQSGEGDPDVREFEFGDEYEFDSGEEIL